MNKQIYVTDNDLLFFKEAVEFSQMSLSATIGYAMRQYVYLKREQQLMLEAKGLAFSAEEPARIMPISSLCPHCRKPLINSNCSECSRNKTGLGY